MTPRVQIEQIFLNYLARWVSVFGAIQLFASFASSKTCSWQFNRLYVVTNQWKLSDDSLSKSCRVFKI